MTQILYTTDDAAFFVVRGQGGKGFEVYRNEATHSVRVSTIGFEGQRGFDRAMEEVERWQKRRTK